MAYIIISEYIVIICALNKIKRILLGSNILVLRKYPNILLARTLFLWSLEFSSYLDVELWTHTASSPRTFLLYIEIEDSTTSQTQHRV